MFNKTHLKLEGHWRVRRQGSHHKREENNLKHDRKREEEKLGNNGKKDPKIGNKKISPRGIMKLAAEMQMRFIRKDNFSSKIVDHFDLF